MNEKKPILTIKNLSVTFRMYESGLRQRDLRVISDLDLTAYPGEILAIAGSSGSGKSLLASGILGILPGNATVCGEMLYKGKELTPARQEALRGREIALVPQSVTYLDPLMKVGAQVVGDGGGKRRNSRGGNSVGREVESASGVQCGRSYSQSCKSSGGKIRSVFGVQDGWSCSRNGRSAGGQGGSASYQKMARVFERLGLPENTARLYPFQLSGGMARRVLVSTALITEAELIIADEPTPGMSLDQALEALQMFRELAEEGKAVILITHDIDLAFAFADRVAVFYAGTTVETAPASDFRAGPAKLRHPYSKALWRALPQNEFAAIPGTQPYAGDLPKGCLFAPRCPLARAECENKMPPVREVRGGEVRCYHAT